MKQTTPSYYAYLIPSTNEQAITTDWKECEAKVKGTDARYKKFSSVDDAKLWLADGAKYLKPFIAKIKKKDNTILDKDGVFFDAGTGRGEGTEVRLTNINGEPLLDPLITNKYGNLHLGKDYTNNYGELLGLCYALEYALKNNKLLVYGDSGLVITYWSKGHIKQTLPEKTITLANKAKILRTAFEKMGGKIIQISGDINPADLGFHKI